MIRTRRSVENRVLRFEQCLLFVCTGEYLARSCSRLMGYCCHIVLGTIRVQIFSAYNSFSRDLRRCDLLLSYELSLSLIIGRLNYDPNHLHIRQMVRPVHHQLGNFFLTRFVICNGRRIDSLTFDKEVLDILYPIPLSFPLLSSTISPTSHQRQYVEPTASRPPP